LKSYLITDPEYYNDITSFTDYLTDIYQNKKPSFAVFRDKTGKNFEETAKNFITVSKYFSIEKILINKDIELAKKLGADGVHLTSSQFDKIVFAKKLGLFVIISTHTLKEALLAQRLKADAITYSPVFYTPNKGKPKGEKKLKEVIKSLDIKCFALGGITGQKEIDICKKCGCYGFASIRYFVKQ